MPKPKRKPARFDGAAPPLEQSHAFAETWQISDGKRARAYRRIPVIDTLIAQGKLSARQHAALARYRDIAQAEDRSYRRDSLDAAMHGGGGGNPGLPPGMASLKLWQTWGSELAWLERELGAMLAIARAVAVDDMTLAQWAMRQSGAIERSRQGPRGTVTWFEPRRIAAKHALADIRMAGERLAPALSMS